MHHHHDAEEQIFFPNIEAISDIQGIMARNVEQHRAFTPGFDLFQEYASTCRPETYDGERLKSLIEGFAEPLIQHLHDEIETLKGLKEYDSDQVRHAYRRLEEALMATDNVCHSQILYTFSINVTDTVSVPNRAPCIRDRGQDIRRRHA